MRRWILVTVLTVWLSPLAGSTGLRAQQDFPHPAPARLAASFEMTSEGQSLREILNGLRRHTGLLIHLDRRIDPDQVIDLPRLGPTVRDVIEQVTVAADAHWVAADEVILIGPQQSIVAAATEMMYTWDRLRALERANRTPLTEPRAVQWPRLSTPAEVLRAVARQWNLSLDQAQLPHDLWAEADLGTVRVTTALGLVLSGFDLGFDLDAATGEVTVRPLGDPQPLERNYPDVPLSAAARSSIETPSIAADGVHLSKSAHGWNLRGDAIAHTRMELAILSTPNRAAAASRNATPERFSLRLENKPAGVALQALCRQAGLRLEYDSALRSVLEQRVTLTATDQPIHALIHQVAERVGLRATIGDAVVHLAEDGA